MIKFLIENWQAVTGMVGIISFCIKVLVELRKAKAGDMCVLRQLMLDIYYRYKDTQLIPQYEAQNFIKMYEAYKARGGNSFMDEVYAHVVTWEMEV